MELNSRGKIKGYLSAWEIPAEFEDQDPEFLIENGLAKCVIENHPNTICNLGFQTLAERMKGSGTYSSETFDYFAVSNGTVTPAASRTAANFLADGANNYTKAVTTLETYGTGANMQQFTCYLTTAENTVASITKFALMNDDPATLMFCEILFSAISKDSSKAIYFKYKLSFAEG